MGNGAKIAMANAAVYAVEGLSWVAVCALLPVSIPAAMAWGREFLFKPLEWTAGVRVWRDAVLGREKDGLSLDAPRSAPSPARRVNVGRESEPTRVLAQEAMPESSIERGQAVPASEAGWGRRADGGGEESLWDASGPEGKTLLMAMAERAAKVGGGSEAASAEVAKLVAGGESVDALDSMGNTALHYAALHANAAMVHALLDSGAKPCVLDAQGDTPLEVFQSKWESETSVEICEAFARLAAQEESWACGSESAEDVRA